MPHFDEASRLPFVKRMKERGLISSISVGVKPQEYDFIVELKKMDLFLITLQLILRMVILIQ